MRILIWFLLSPLAAYAKPPSWYSSPTKVVGKTVIVSCKGDGPDSALSRINALGECRTLANEYLSHEIKIESATIQTDKDTSYHSIVESNSTVKNLICDTLNEFTEEEQGQNTSYLRCKFDLNKVKVKSAPTEVGENVSSLSEIKSKKIIQNSNNIEIAEPDRRSISLSVVPKCEDILITGQRSRTIKCHSNPVQLLIYKTDRKITIRVKDHKPKTIKPSELQSGKEEYEVQVD